MSSKYAVYGSRDEYFNAVWSLFKNTWTLTELGFFCVVGSVKETLFGLNSVKNYL
jgi:hypothetical protein